MTPPVTMMSSARSEGAPMPATVELDPVLTKLIYEQDAERYLRSLPMEHFMESTTQSTQRKITVESLDLVTAVWPEFQVFSELLIQYPVPGEDPHKPARVVPDNMVVLHSEPIDADGSFMLVLQPVGPFLVLEYVSKHTRRKDYIDNRTRYERDLKVPYYLLYYPEAQDLKVFHLVNDRYSELAPNENDRLAIPELELEVAILDGWVRFWFREELLPLPGEWKETFDRERDARAAAERSAAKAERSAARSERARAAAEQSAAQERSARLTLEAEIARLREAAAKTQPPSAS